VYLWGWSSAIVPRVAVLGQVMEPKDAERIARILIRRYLGRSWHFAWTNKKRIHAECDYGTKTIRFSRRVTEAGNLTEFMDTTAHEIAHGLAFRLGHTGHGSVWLRFARVLGATCRRGKDN